MNMLNEQVYKDKVRACWIGKNIGGTMGTPHEGRREILDVRGFASPKSKPLPNDDLDLQLVFLRAIEEQGPYNFSAQLLSEYWTNYIIPHWNEYGIAKSNLRAGILPPLSGELNNDRWKNSNGAWIRSEIWACLAPGCPDIAVKYAFMDACIDHGINEGTYAEIFTAALQSCAFIISDIRELISIGLSKIPKDCRIARSIGIVTKAYDEGVEWTVARNLLVEDSSDLGWFQAPANVGFVILGLLYGKGDFKSSILHAVNCGDDTDCTGATVGSVLGIIGGTAAIAQDWQEYIGDDIITVAVDRSALWLPKTCAELSERVCEMAPIVLRANNAALKICRNDTFICDTYIENTKESSACAKILSQSRFSYNVQGFIYANAVVEYDCLPRLSPMESITARVRFINTLPDPRTLLINVLLPEGWRGENYKRTLYMDHQNPNGELWEITVTAGERLEAVNHIIVQAQAPGRPSAGFIPIVVLG